jgi:hypothetical protein
LAIYVRGNVDVPGVGKAAAFHILVPISYVLLLSAGLLRIGRFHRYTFHVVCISCLLGVFFLRFNSIPSANLEILAIGLLGVTAGYVPIEKIDNAVVGHPYLLVCGYLCYAAAITVWGVGYLQLVVGTCFSLLLIYLVGAKKGEPGRARRHIILLGKYALFGYIAQIAVLQLVFRGLRHIRLEAGVVGISFFAAFVLTMLTVEVVDRMRAKSTRIDWVYKAVFA